MFASIAVILQLSLLGVLSLCVASRNKKARSRYFKNLFLCLMLCSLLVIPTETCLVRANSKEPPGQVPLQPFFGAELQLLFKVTTRDLLGQALLYAIIGASHIAASWLLIGLGAIERKFLCCIVYVDRTLHVRAYRANVCTFRASLRKPARNATLYNWGLFRESLLSFWRKDSCADRAKQIPHIEIPEWYEFVSAVEYPFLLVCFLALDALTPLLGFPGWLLKRSVAVGTSFGRNQLFIISMLAMFRCAECTDKSLPASDPMSVFLSVLGGLFNVPGGGLRKVIVFGLELHRMWQGEQASQNDETDLLTNSAKTLAFGPTFELCVLVVAYGGYRLLRGNPVSGPNDGKVSIVINCLRASTERWRAQTRVTEEVKPVPSAAESELAETLRETTAMLKQLNDRATQDRGRTDYMEKVVVALATNVAESKKSVEDLASKMSPPPSDTGSESGLDKPSRYNIRSLGHQVGQVKADLQIAKAQIRSLSADRLN